MFVADHNSAVRRNFKSRAMPEKEIPPARLVDIYSGTTNKPENTTTYALVQTSAY